MAKTPRQHFGGNWTEEKLRALGNYLDRYLIALSKQKFTLEYIDAFAGTGYREQAKEAPEAVSLFGEVAESQAQQYLDGSATLALQLKRAFDMYNFVEKSSEKAAQLESLKGQFPHRADRVNVITSDANEYLLRRSKENWLREQRRAVVFIDPFGMQVDWTTVEALANTQAVDLWLLYPVSAINRLLSREGVRFEQWKARLDRVFGGGSWFDAFYRRSQSKPSLFEPDPGEVYTKSIDIDGLTRFMVSKLESCYAGVVKQPLVLKSPKGHPLFALCFAAANQRGAQVALRIANHIVGG
jgi:three-Cys-motif partner protein